MSLSSDGLNNVFRAMVLSRIQYALPVYSGNLLQSDIDRINAARFFYFRLYIFEGP